MELSFIDKLVDTSEGKRPKNAREMDREFRASLCRDLTDLLNTRRSERDINPIFDEVSKSLLCYGIPDFIQRDPVNKGDVDRVEKSIKIAIKQFEPRLTDVNVEWLESKPLGLRFRIDARLREEDAEFHATVQCEAPRAKVTEAS